MSSGGSGSNQSTFPDDPGAPEEWQAVLLGIAHDLRAPLSVFDGYMRMLASGDLGSMPEQARRALDVMTRKVAEMHSLVDGVVEAARPEKPLDQAADRRSLDLADVAGEAVDRAVPGARLAGVKLHLAIAGRAPVDADPRLLGRILDNLLNNAIMHTGRGRSVTVSVQDKGRHGQVRVGDDGPGVSADVRAKLFDPVDRDHAPSSRGAGLGLYICRLLASRCGASLMLEPECERGATFLLDLPLAACNDNGAYLSPSVR